jgi:hypothetical protein
VSLNKGGSVARTELWGSLEGRRLKLLLTAFLKLRKACVQPNTDGAVCTRSTLAAAKGDRSGNEGFLAQVLVAPGGCSLGFQDAPLLQEAMVLGGEETGE